MINKTFCDTVTVYHQEKSIDEATKRSVVRWIRTVYPSCYFGSHIAESLNGTTLAIANGYTVRIPADVPLYSVCPGDIVVKGDISDEATEESGNRITDILNRYKPNSFTVRAVADNTKIRYGAHIKLIGA